MSLHNTISVCRNEQACLRGGQEDVLQFLQACMADIHRDMLSDESGTGQLLI